MIEGASIFSEMCYFYIVLRNEIEYWKDDLVNWKHFLVLEKLTEIHLPPFSIRAHID